VFDERADQVQWLTKCPTPLFLACAKKKPNLSIYHMMIRFLREGQNVIVGLKILFMNLQDRFPHTKRYQPTRDANGLVTESEQAYIARIHVALPAWPEELVREWLFRHADFMEDYGQLGFERLRFTLEPWPLRLIPGREAFRDPRFCDDFQDVEQRVENKYDWLAKYMLKAGTWNTPIVLFENPKNAAQPSRDLKSPYHLLEGHRRLAFLNGLRRLGKAHPEHSVWITRLRQ
jgi:hypothetical protein